MTDVDVFPYRLHDRLFDEEIYFANPDCRPARSLTKSENLQLGVHDCGQQPIGGLVASERYRRWTLMPLSRSRLDL